MCDTNVEGNCDRQRSRIIHHHKKKDVAVTEVRTREGTIVALLGTFSFYSRQHSLHFDFFVITGQGLPFVASHLPIPASCCVRSFPFSVVLFFETMSILPQHQALLEAARLGDLECAKELCSQGANPQVCDTSFMAIPPSLGLR